MLQFSLEHLYQVLKAFYTLTHIRIALFDSRFQEVFSYPEDKFLFCDMIRKNAGANNRCIESDSRGCLACAQKRKLVLYKCHAGLTEAVVPIYDKSGIIGYMFFGQILPKEGYEKAKQQLRNRYFEQEFPGITEAIDQIPAKSNEELNAAALVLQSLTSYVLTNHWITPGKSEFIRKLDQYIEQHIRENITVADLCSQFHIGRTRLYRAAAEYLGCGLAEYIRNQRIEYAQKLLTETDIPIAEIAYATGFSDYNHFSRVFKQVCGVSARAFRNGKKSS